MFKKLEPVKQSDPGLSCLLFRLHSFDDIPQGNVCLLVFTV